MTFSHILHGDGIHDDFPAIQERIDSGLCELTLPAPERFYLISQTLTLPSNFKLTLPRLAEIRLAAGSNCPMLSNRPRREFAERLPDSTTPLCRHFWYFVNEFAPEISSENIEIRGGIWNFNNSEQLGNPEQTKIFEPYGYTGDGMLFYGVRGLTLGDMTFKDPTHYGALLDRVEYFTVENLVFDYNYGNPNAVNMDGIHLNGNCHYGLIRNLKGACYDDLVALNAHEGSRGPITNIEIDGLFAEDCHSAVRLLTVYDDVKSIRISNVYGTYYQYCIGLTKYYPGETTGRFKSITLDGIHASKAERLPIYAKGNSYVYPLIWLQSDTAVESLRIRDLCREEYTTPVETIHIGAHTTVKSLTLDCITSENHTGSAMPLIVNNGSIERLTLRDIDSGEDELLVSKGTVGELKE